MPPFKDKSSGTGADRSAARASFVASAVILAAGAGTRLGDLGRQYSKATVPVAGKPLIKWVIDDLRRAGLERIIVVGHPSDTRLAALLASQHADITLVQQQERKGIADAVRCALPLVARQPGFLACACDSLFLAADIAQVIEVGCHHAGSAVVGVLAMDAAATATRSAVRVDGDMVVEIVEKPTPGTVTSGLVAMPLYWLPRQFARYLERVAPLGGERYVSTALNAFLADRGVVLSVMVRQRVEVTTAADVERATALLPGAIRS